VFDCSGEKWTYHFIADGVRCAKLHAKAKGIINNRVAKGLFVAQGDNCEGRPEGVELL